MAAACGGALAAATSAGGGFGIIGAGYYDAAKLAQEIDNAKTEFRKRLQPSTLQESDDLPLPIGVGYLVWKLTQINKGKAPTASDPPDTSEGHKMIELMVKERCPAIWLSFGEPKDVRAWFEYARAREEAASRSKEERMKFIIGAGNYKEVEQAATLYKADIISVTGGEAGGHGLADAPPLPALLAEVKRNFAAKGIKPLPPLLGAGGLSDGASLASIMALGAAGGVFGTRYLLTPQAQYTDKQKKILLESTGETLRTMAFDEARGTTGWPKGVDGRGVFNQTVVDYDAGHDEESRRKRYEQAAKEQDSDRIVTWSGTGVGNMNDIIDAADLTQKLTAEAKEAIESLRSVI
jgi:nitronate monooxygenase